MARCSAWILWLTLAEAASGQTSAIPSTLTGRWIGSVASHGAVAGVTLTIDDSSGALPLAFSFLGNTRLATAVEASKDGVRIALRESDGRMHLMSGIAWPDSMAGDYQGPDRRGRFFLRRTVASIGPGARPMAGVYGAGGRPRLLVRAARSGTYLLLDLQTGMRRRLASDPNGGFSYGSAMEDFRVSAGRLELIGPTDAASESLRWTADAGGAPALTLERIRVEERSLTWENDRVRLDGTLLLPSGAGPFPAVVLVHGSGPATRESERERAMLFVSRGVAALIYDKRGSGRSGGDLDRATFDVLAQDALAGVRRLRAEPEIIPGRIGVHGVSQGGWIAPLAAVRSSDVAFVMTVSGPGVPVDAQELYRRQLNLEGRGYLPGPGVADPELGTAKALLRRYLEFVRTGRGRQRVDRELRAAAGTEWATAAELPDSLGAGTLPGWLTAFRQQMAFDPAATWRRVRVPALVLFGALDPFVPAEQSVAALTPIIRSPGSLLRSFPDADHWMFQRDPADPRMPDRGYVPAYLDLLTAWLDAQVKPAPPDPAGFWQGSIRLGAVERTLHLEIGRRGDTLIAFMDAPGRGQYRVRLLNVRQRGDTIRVTYPLPSSGFVLRGRLEAGGTRIRGSGWEAGFSGPVGDTATFELVRGSEPTRAVSAEEVLIRDGALELRGELVRPLASDRVPAVVWIPGSGDQTRSSGLAYADVMARNGIATLLLDKRGTGGSSGDWKRVGLDSLAGDVVAALRYLQARRDIDGRRLGLVGESQAGWIAVQAADRFPGLRAMALVGAAFTSVEAEGFFDYEERLRQGGFDETARQAALELVRLDFEVSRGRYPFDSLAARAAAVRDAPWYKEVMPFWFPAPADHWSRQWYALTLDFDPAGLLDRLEVPGLFVYGMRDETSPVASSTEVLQRAAHRAGKNYSVVLWAGADHSLMESEGTAGEFFKSLSTPALDLVGDWVRRMIGVPQLERE